jgi:hypothetical protein
MFARRGADRLAQRDRFEVVAAARSAAVMTKCRFPTVPPSLEEFDATPDPFGDDFDPGA